MQVQTSDIKVNHQTILNETNEWLETVQCQKITEWFYLPSFPLVDSACLVLRIRGGYNLKDASAIDAVRKSNTPTLFIHGDEDAMISVQMSKDLYEAANCRKELLIVEGAGHAQAMDKDPDLYWGTVKAFLENVT